MRRISLLLVAAAILALSGCDSSPSVPPPSRLFNDYLNSTTVTDDVITGSATAADRRADIAARGSPEDFLGRLFSASQCDDTYDDPACPPPNTVNEAAQDASATVYTRRILVEHRDGRLDLTWVYLVVSADHAELFDSSGRGYPGGLDDFRAHNSLFTADDLVLTPDPLTSPTGAFRLQVVTGHTQPGHVWLYVLLGVAGLAAVVVAVAVVRRLREPPLFPDVPDRG